MPELTGAGATTTSQIIATPTTSRPHRFPMTVTGSLPVVIAASQLRPISPSNTCLSKRSLVFQFGTVACVTSSLCSGPSSVRARQHIEGQIMSEVSADERGSKPPDVKRSQTRLSGHLGTTSLVLSVLAFSAPVVTVSGYIAFAIGFAGEAAPLALVVATVVLVIFSVGYTTMTKHIHRPGAFYAYISLGLGKVPGVGAAYLASISYILIQVGVYAF